jgi:RNA polymerase sigma-70 factor (ECF subfamily)
MEVYAAVDARVPPGLEPALQAIVARARSCWPTIDLDPARFIRYVAERVEPGYEPIGALGAMHTTDMYLACACTQGHPAAHEILEKAHLVHIADFVAQTDASPAFADEVRQLLREKLLVAKAGAEPKIGAYTGRGSLGGWLRVVSVRTARNWRRSQRRADRGSAAVAEHASPALDPELALLKVRYARAFEEAFAHTIARLPSDECTMLSLHYLDGVSAEAIGKLYRVSARTVRRRIADSRAHIIEETHRLLRDQLQLGETELRNLMPLVRSQVNLSIRRLLKRPA